MIQAELRGKLMEIENSEDVLTSNVFGLLRYVSNDVFLKILSHAKTISGKKFLDCINVNLNDYTPTFIFWQKIKDYGEPDLIIKFTNENGNELVLCIEVKYYSSKSGEEDNDQLRRYFEGLSILKNKSEFLGVIYLTKYPARIELETSLKCIGEMGLKNVEERLFQLRWFEITKTLEKFEKEKLNDTDKKIIDDLLTYLRYKNFIEFEGFTFMSKRINKKIENFYETKILFFNGFTFSNKDFDIPKNKTFYEGE